MIVQLERVVLAAAAGAAAGGLSLRIDRGRPSVDWTRGGVDPGLGAYALAPTTGQTVTLQAQFSFSDTSGLAGPSVTVRAKTADPDTMPFGGVGPTAVPVPGASANMVTPLISLPLNQVRLLERGVGKYAMTLRWQFQETAGAPWVDFDSSTHVVYVTLDAPGAPWSQATTAAGQLRQPWARVLDWSCLWAQGVTITDGDLSGAIDKTARRIEAGLYALGQRDEVPLEYQDAGSGGAYATEYPDQVAFLCTKFLRLLAGDTAPEIETAVDCSDCAAALVVFANVLGCDLTSKRVVAGDTTFQTNPVLAIGRAANNPRGYGFGYHEVAGRGQAATSFRVSDACLMVDRDADPTRADDSHAFGLAQGLSLTTITLNPARFRYVHRLIREADWPGLTTADVAVRCLDDCGAVAMPVDAITEGLHQDYLRMINNAVRDTPTAGGAKIDVTPMPLPGFMAYHRDLETPQFSALKRFVKQSVDFYYVASPGRVRRAPTRPASTMADRRVRVCLGSAGTPSQAQDALAWVLAQSAVRLSLLTEHGKPVVGDVGFAGPRAGSVFFVRGNTLAWLSSTGREPASLTPLATTVDVVVNRKARRHR